MTYMISWGTSFNDLTVPVKLPKYKGSLGSNLSLDKYEMPASYKSFREENLDEDICVRVTLIDKVGNKNYIDTLVPKQVD